MRADVADRAADARLLRIGPPGGLLLPGLFERLGQPVLGILDLDDAELAKLALIAYLAPWLAARTGRVTSAAAMLPFALIVGVVTGLVIAEPDLGTAIVIVVVALVLYFAAGARLAAFAALGAYAHRDTAFRTGWLVAAALVHASLVGAVWAAPPRPGLCGWIAVDPIGLIVLSVVSALFLAAAIYAVGYLRRENPRGGRAFVSCLLAFLAAAALVDVGQPLGPLGVGLEATTV